MSEMNQPAPSLTEQLLQALSKDSALACEQAEELIPVLVQAEASGEDVFFDPQFAKLFQHFDTCERCAETYAALAAELEAFIQRPFTSASPATLARPTTPPLQEYRSSAWVLQVWEDLVRTLEFALEPFIPTSRVPVLGPNEQERELFADRIPDLSGKPIFTVMLQRQDDQFLLRVVLRDIRTASSWQVQLSAGAKILHQQTNEQGIAEFPNITQADLAAGIIITCAEHVK